MRSHAFLVLALTVATAACTKDPQQPVATQPASDAAGAAQPAEVPAQELREPSILAAQIGSKLGENGLLAESLPSISTGQPIHALAVFRGPDGASGKVEVQVFGEASEPIFTETKGYTLKEGASVGFQVAEAGKLTAGKYRALFLCNGGPCWEIPFTVE